MEKFKTKRVPLLREVKKGKTMYLSGFTDEAGKDFAVQLRVLKKLGWHNMESRAIGDSNLAGITDAQFEELQQKLSEADVKINCYGSTVANWANPITESPDKYGVKQRFPSSECDTTRR